VLKQFSFLTESVVELQYEVCFYNMLDSKFWAKYFVVYDTLNQLIPYQELLELFLQKLDALAINVINIVSMPTYFLNAEF